MIKPYEFDDVFDKIRTSYFQYDEHVLRVHLLVYSADSSSEQFRLLHSNRSKIGISRVLLQNLVDKDPLEIGVNPDQVDLKELVKFQINQFIGKRRDRRLDYQSVRALYSVDGEPSESGFEIIFEKPEDLNIAAGLLVDDFYDRSAKYPGPEFEALIINQIQRRKVDSIVTVNDGIANLALSALKYLNHEDHQVVQEPLVCVADPLEYLLCILILWSENVWWPFGVWFGFPFDDVDSDIFCHDLAIVLSPLTNLDASMPDYLDPSIFRLSHNTMHAENAYVELGMLITNDFGQAVTVVPERFLSSPGGRQLREYAMTNDLITSITSVPERMTPDLDVPMAIIAFDRSKDYEQKNRITFRYEDSAIGRSTEFIRDENPDLNLLPLRFLNSIEYSYRAVFSLFDRGILNIKLRAGLVKIISVNDHRLDIYHDLFNSMRKILEAVYRSIIEREINLTEINLFIDQTVVKMENCRRYLSGDSVKRYANDPAPLKRSEQLLPQNVSLGAKICQNLTNQFSHYGSETPTRIEFGLAVMCLLALLEWWSDEVSSS